MHAGVLSEKDLLPHKKELSAIKPMPAVFDKDWVKKLENTTNVKKGKSKWDLAEALRDDIKAFKKENKCPSNVNNG